MAQQYSLDYFLTTFTSNLVAVSNWPQKFKLTGRSNYYKDYTQLCNIITKYNTVFHSLSVDKY